jgi:hypothetical protein
MSVTIIGYDKNGHRILRDEGPARARPAGHGGSAMGAFAGVVLTVAPPLKVKLPRQPLSVTRPAA